MSVLKGVEDSEVILAESNSSHTPVSCSARIIMEVESATSCVKLIPTDICPKADKCSETDSSRTPVSCLQKLARQEQSWKRNLLLGRCMENLMTH